MSTDRTLSAGSSSKLGRFAVCSSGVVVLWWWCALVDDHSLTLSRLRSRSMVRAIGARRQWNEGDAAATAAQQWADVMLLLAAPLLSVSRWPCAVVFSVPLINR